MSSKVVAFVPMKLQNERLPNKHFLPLNGRPLCYHVFNSLKRVPGLADICLFASTRSIMSHLPDGITFVERDPYFDGAEVKGLEFFRAFAETVAADYYLLAHATAPFLRSQSMTRGLEAVKSGTYDSAFTAQRIQTYVWYEGRPLNYLPTDMARTQNITPIFVETSGFYLYSRDEILRRNRRIGERPFFVEVHGAEAIDIDYPEDYEAARRWEDVLEP